MKKAIALSITQDSFKPAYLSARNFGALLIDAMYGTPQRTKMTYLFALALLVLGFSLDMHNSTSLAVCGL